MKRFADHLPGIALFLVALIIGIYVAGDYGIAWDEPITRETGWINYNYAFNNDQQLLLYQDRYYGAGFELVLVFIEKWTGITSTADIFHMRHLANHILFLLAALSLYFLIFRLFKSKPLACLAFIMLVCMPRIYAHSFFNSKDIPMLSMYLITLSVSHWVFGRGKLLRYVLLGMLAGYTTSIRIPGLILAVLLAGYMVVDIISDIASKRRPGRSLSALGLFAAGFLVMLYAAWPYLWEHPFANFAESYAAMAHFHWTGDVFYRGAFIASTALPLNYFPTWFFITVPELWLIAGLAGIVLVIYNTARRPMQHITNTTDRFIVLALLCFAAPVAAVLLLHSVIYDDWRHLYFIYPSFLIMVIYAISKVQAAKFRMAILGLCVVQLTWTGYFMVKSHPIEQVYFNAYVPHSDEYLHNNYELDYWGSGFKQALEQLVAAQPADTILVGCNPGGVAPLRYNIQMLPEQDRQRIMITDPRDADYFITNFRFATFMYPSAQLMYSVNLMNSTIYAVYKAR